MDWGTKQMKRHVKININDCLVGCKWEEFEE